jgi:hypothetical protein
MIMWLPLYLYAVTFGLLGIRCAREPEAKR